MNITKCDHATCQRGRDAVPHSAMDRVSTKDFGDPKANEQIDESCHQDHELMRRSDAFESSTSNMGMTADDSATASRKGTPESLSRSGSIPLTLHRPAAIADVSHGTPAL